MAKIKVAVISSDPMMLRFLRRNLSNDDYDVVVTPGVEELQSLLAKELPDLVIQDIMMPNLDGLSVSLQIRQWSQVPLLMLSAWGAGADKVRGLDLSADDYLTEPFDADALIMRMKEILKLNQCYKGCFENSGESAARKFLNN